MKTRPFITAAFMAIALCACSSEKVSHDASHLPAEARDMIARNFNSAISIVETEEGFGKTLEYEVILTDGAEITFTKNGEWKSIETPNNRAIPEGLVPTAIAGFIAEKHAGAYIVGIEKNKKGYEIELSNGVDMQFDKAGNFLNYDK